MMVKKKDKNIKNEVKIFSLFHKNLIFLKNNFNKEKMIK